MLSAWPFLIVILLSVIRGSPILQGPASDSKRRATALFEEGQNAHERGDLNLAVSLYSGALAADPSLFQAYYQRAVALAALGRSQEAEADLRKTIGLKPDFARAHRALGQLLLDRGSLEEAKRELERAMELDPKLPSTRIYYASALLRANEAERAAAMLRQAIADGEATPLAYALLGMAEESSGQLEEALSSYSRAIELDSNQAIAREGRARIFEARGQIDRAIEELLVAYRARPSQDLSLWLARLYARSDQPAAAIHIYRELLRERPEDRALRFEMIRIMIESGLEEDAAREVKLLLGANASDPELLLLAADLYFKDKPEVAAGYLRRAVEVDPANLAARARLGVALVRSRQFQEAIPILEEALARDPEDQNARAGLATALFELKQYQKAAQEFARLASAKPNLATARYFLAISLDRMGNCAAALEQYRKFVQMADPASREIEDAKIRLSLLEKLARDGKCKSR
jgi:tetratricopeptide (TPR) repeat protein